ncbi:diphosphomevalonate/mevalonate 3,5-bisphosphate decarboxylase family protein [Legionella sp. km772]|uniref:diphosphomevalonate/mevalonate 3,5-bisphosphate decarboxylase family protein n=1 Tax=Legionella sp. km772 TaxID=2498111 RepID=UPI000F8F75FD|nr:diphosphomevalonate decarboxylase [Legionella sp. km772]RUR10564.1 diphosphomevalonate decarboxylase [Legionella sp. km772]
MHWLAQAPANIALIKYMGKKDASSNLPDNSSLSYTLNNLLSTVRLELIAKDCDLWQPLPLSDSKNDFTLAKSAQERFIAHLQRLKAYFGYSGHFLIQSNNNFPHGSGLASSASSFAALTRCAVLALSELSNKELPTTQDQAQLSRLGSGSSCRSFYSPWALWRENEVLPLELPYTELKHQVIVLSNKEKKVSSSEAHRRVRTSTLYNSRSKRAEERLNQLLLALNAMDWPSIYQLCWDDFQEMHQLFSSCADPFSYITEESVQLLDTLSRLWEREGDGPLVTMDAGPNIHLLYRLDQAEKAEQFQAEHLAGRYHVL